MITQEKLDELKDRMIHHDVENDAAVVKLYANELHELIETCEKFIKFWNGFKFKDEDFKL